MGNTLCIGNKTITKEDISNMSFEEKFKYLDKIQKYKEFLNQREDYIEDVASLQHPEKYSLSPNFINFEKEVSAKEVLSFLKNINV